MVETRDLAVQLRQLNLELLRQLWVGQDAVRRSVAKAASGVSTLAKSQGERGLPNPQARIQAFQVLLRSVPILLMMRKLSEFQCGKVWPGTLQRLSKDEERVGGW